MLRPAVVDGVELWGRRQVQADSIKRVALTQVLEGKTEGSTSVYETGSFLLCWRADRLDGSPFL